MNIEQLKQFATLYDSLNSRIYDVGEAINRNHYVDYENTLDSLTAAVESDDATISFAMEDSYQGCRDVYRVDLPIEVMTVEDYKPLVEKALEERQRKMEEERKQKAIKRAEQAVRVAEIRLISAADAAKQELERAKLNLAKVQLAQAKS